MNINREATRVGIFLTAHGFVELNGQLLVFPKVTVLRRKCSSLFTFIWILKSLFCYKVPGSLFKGTYFLPEIYFHLLFQTHALE